MVPTHYISKAIPFIPSLKIWFEKEGSHAEMFTAQCMIFDTLCNKCFPIENMKS